MGWFLRLFSRQIAYPKALFDDDFPSLGGISLLPKDQRTSATTLLMCSPTASSSSTEVDCITPPKTVKREPRTHGFCGLFQDETIWTVSWRKRIAEIFFRKKSNRLMVGFYFLQAVPWLCRISSINGPTVVLGWCWNFEKIIISWKNKHWSISMVLLCIRLAPTVSRGHQFRTWSRIYLLHSWHYSTYHTIPSATNHYIQVKC